MLRLWTPRHHGTGLPVDVEYAPGMGVVRKLDQHQRWQLAGQYAARHVLTGPWFRRCCATCGTRGRCIYRRWAQDVLTEQVRREWFGR